MAYPNQYFPQYQQPYQSVPAPMDRLAQLQAQQYQMPQPSMQHPPQTNQGLLWVQGESAARSYLVAPNSTVLLMDSESPVFYLKSADGSGMPLPLRAFDYKERTQDTPQNTPQAPQIAQTDLDSKYVTRAEYDALNGKYAEILDRLNNFPAAPVLADNGGKPAAATNKSRNRGGNADGKSDI